MKMGTDTKKMVDEQAMVEAAINNKVEEGERKRGSCITSTCSSKSTSISTTVTTTTTTTTPFPITKYISGQVFDHLICSRFLLPADMISLLQVNGISESFPQLSQRYCKIHGVKLDLTYEDYVEHHCHRPRDQDRDSSSSSSSSSSSPTGADNDARFLLWCLEQQAFILAATATAKTDDTDIAVDDEPPSLSPDCLDCRMARFHNKKRCPCCNDFEYYEAIFTCGKIACKTKIACMDCHEGMNICNKEGCHDDDTYCTGCFEGYYCESCDNEYHTKCIPVSICSLCGDPSCLKCVDSGNSNYTCDVCVGSFCRGCRYGIKCSKCSKESCEGCNESFHCDNCNEFFCCGCDEFGGIGCSLCENVSCSECEFTYCCDSCDSFYCSGCRTPGIFCKMCNEMSCSECEPDYNTCMFCDQDFCADCKGGSFIASCRHRGWECVDCLQTRANSTSKSKTNNEGEGDSCANCFLSEDDMDNVNLKQCSRCKTVKYCSRACQKANWKEHRRVCNTAAVASDDNDVEEKMKGGN